MPDIATVKEKVQAYLTSQGPVQIDSSGRYSLQWESCRVFVEVVEHPNGDVTLVKIVAPILFEVPITPDVYEYVALHADDWFFGSLGLWPNDDKSAGMLVMGHALLGDFLDKEELMYAVFGVGGTVDELDDELQAKFGGKRFIDT
jgi:hypothetical protein